MKISNSLFIIVLALAINFIPVNNSYSGITEIIPETDAAGFQQIGFFDLRERDTFLQLTHTDAVGSSYHIQIFDVANNCNENNFFDNYTPNDTHVYNLADIQTNDGNPSGVVLPDNAYGIVYVTYAVGSPGLDTLVGNIRILDNNGYEYRTNLSNANQDRERDELNLTFNFNTNSGVTLSDIVGISSSGLSQFMNDEVRAADIVNIWSRYDIDIIDNNEVALSCRDVVFACTDQNNPLYEALLEESEVSVASFEYGINNAIPHSKGGELLCPGNTISEGVVELEKEGQGDETNAQFVLFVGLNNGDGRGSMDTVWYGNTEIPFEEE